MVLKKDDAKPTLSSNLERERERVLNDSVMECVVHLSLLLGYSSLNTHFSSTVINVRSF